MKITGKIISLVVSGVLVMGIVTGFLSISSFQDRGQEELLAAREMLLEGKKAKLINLVQSVCSIVGKTDSKKEAIKIVRSIRYGERGKGYLWSLLQKL